MFNKILDSFAEGNELLLKYVICITSIRVNTDKVNEITKTVSWWNNKGIVNEIEEGSKSDFYIFYIINV